MSIVLLVLGLALFSGLIASHEFGHFLMARRNGVEVEEFALFFPPRLFRRKTKDGWYFVINLLPIGGYVKLKGEHDSDTAKGSFGAASTWVKTKIMLAGITVNLLTAVVLFTILAVIGMPKIVPNQYTVQKDTHVTSNLVLITYVQPGSPAAKAGLKTEDEITAIRQPGYSPVDVTSSDKLPDVTKAFAGKNVIVYFKRGGQDSQVRLTLLSTAAVKASQNTANPKGYMGISPTEFTVQRSGWSAPVTAIGLSVQLTVLTFQGLGHALAGLGSLIAGLVTDNHVARQNGQYNATSEVSGPIGIFVILKDFSLIGYQFVLFVIAYISLVLGIMNLLPIPALDGGRLWLMLASRLSGHKLSARTEETVNLVGFMVLLSLIILISINDVIRFH